MIAVLPVRAEGWFPYKPHATAALVAVNWLVALLIGCTRPALDLLRASNPVLLDALVLRYDQFHPWTWITSVFVHGNLLHLAGNMGFLLAFGMIVEGVLGWKRYLTLYLVIAVVSGALEQAMFFATDSGSVGASGCIYGLMAAACLLAPRRKVTVFYWFFYSFGTHPVSATAAAGWWIGWDLIWAVASGFMLWTPTLHILGAAAGFAAALWMLRSGRVDCGDEDWFTLRDKDKRRETLATARSIERGRSPMDLDPYPKVEPPDPRELLASFLSWTLPLVGGILVVIGLGMLRMLDWTASTAMLRMLFAIALVAAGGGTFAIWKSRC